jgi:hypothetical protein
VLLGKNIQEDLKSNPNLKILCVTYNRDDYIVTNPKNALAAYIAFLKKVKGSGFDIPFENLVSRELINKYRDMIDS